MQSVPCPNTYFRCTSGNLIFKAGETDWCRSGVFQLWAVTIAEFKEYNNHNHAVITATLQALRNFPFPCSQNCVPISHLNNNKKKHNRTIYILQHRNLTEGPNLGEYMCARAVPAAHTPAAHTLPAQQKAIQVSNVLCCRRVSTSPFHSKQTPDAAST